MKSGSIPLITTKDLTRCSLVVKFVLWEHVSEVRFFPPRPFWGHGVIGNALALQVRVRGSIPRASTKIWKRGRAWFIAPVLKTDDQKWSVSSNLTVSASFNVESLSTANVSEMRDSRGETRAMPYSYNGITSVL